MELQYLNVGNIVKTRQEDILLTTAQDDFNRVLKVHIDDQYELAKQERELASLRTGGIALQELLKRVSIDRVNAEIDAEKEFAKTQEELRRRNDPSKRAHDITLLLKKEYNQRIADELELDNRIAVLRQQSDDGYFTSLDHRRRVEKQGVEGRLREQADLNTRLIELDDELAHHNENSALRYAVVWREALLEVQKRHEDAVGRDQTESRDPGPAEPLRDDEQRDRERDGGHEGELGERRQRQRRIGDDIRQRRDRLRSVPE